MSSNFDRPTATATLDDTHSFEEEHPGPDLYYDLFYDGSFYITWHVLDAASRFSLPIRFLAEVGCAMCVIIIGLCDALCAACESEPPEPPEPPAPQAEPTLANAPAPAPALAAGAALARGEAASGGPCCAVTA